MQPSEESPLNPPVEIKTPKAESAVELELKDRMIGEILSLARPLSDVKIQQILEYQRHNSMRFGEAAIAMGLATREEVVWALSKQFHYPYAANRPSSPLHEELVMANGPFSSEVECFRILRSQLTMGILSASATPRRALAFVSPDIGDGKTFVLSNLAVAFSQLRGRTLIVDADMRSSRLHEVFKLDNSTGLSGILNGRAEANVIRPVSDLPNLYLLPVGAVPPNPTELIHHPSFGLLIQELLTRFDNVLVDTPAAVHGSDACVIAATCGAALVVTRKDQTRSAGLQELLRQLGQTHTQVAGVLMNAY